MMSLALAGLGDLPSGHSWDAHPRCGMLLAAHECTVSDWSPASAASWITEQLDALPSGGVAWENTNGLLALLRGDVRVAEGHFRTAYRHIMPAVSKLAVAKNLWWVSMVIDGSPDWTEDDDFPENVQEEIVLPAFTAAANKHTGPNDDTSFSPLLSIFDLPLQVRICHDPQYGSEHGRYAGDGSCSGRGEPASWRERYMDLMKRSLTYHLYRAPPSSPPPPGDEVDEHAWDVEQGSTGIVDPEPQEQGHTVMRIASLTHLQLLAEDVIARGVPGEASEQLNCRPCELAVVANPTVL